MLDFNAPRVVADTLLDLGIKELGAHGFQGESILALIVIGAAAGHKGAESILLVRADKAAVQLVVHGGHRGSNVGGATGSDQEDQAGKDCNVEKGTGERGQG